MRRIDCGKFKFLEFGFAFYLFKIIVTHLEQYHVLQLVKI